MGYTRKQRDLLAFVAEYQQSHGVSPTLEEIGENFGVSRVTVFQHVGSLEKKGALRRRAREARSLEILDPDFLPSVGLPILGSIAAGSPIEVIDEGVDCESLQVEDVFPQSGDHYLLRVRGNSMIDDHIADGDLVFVERSITAHNGDTVVAILPGDGIEEATLKRYYREADCIRLEPRNPMLEPIRVKEVEIRGIVRGVLRQY